MFNFYLECFGTSIVSATVEKPIRQNLTTRDSRLDESATAVIVLQRGSLLSPNIASNGFSKWSSLFFRFSTLKEFELSITQPLSWNVSHLNWISKATKDYFSLQRFFSQCDFSTNSNSQVHLQWLFSSLQRFSLWILSHRTALNSLDLLVYLLTSLNELLTSQPESTQWLKTNLIQGLDCNVKRH